MRRVEKRDRGILSGCRTDISHYGRPQGAGASGVRRGVRSTGMIRDVRVVRSTGAIRDVRVIRSAGMIRDVRVTGNLRLTLTAAFDGALTVNLPACELYMILKDLKFHLVRFLKEPDEIGRNRGQSGRICITHQRIEAHLKNVTEPDQSPELHSLNAPLHPSDGYVRATELLRQILLREAGTLAELPDVFPIDFGNH